MSLIVQEGLEWQRYTVQDRWNDHGTLTAGIHMISEAGSPGSRIGLRTSICATWTFDEVADGTPIPNWRHPDDYSKADGGRGFDYSGDDDNSRIRAYDWGDEVHRHVMRVHCSPTEDTWYIPQAMHNTYSLYSTEAPYYTVPWFLPTDPAGSEQGFLSPDIRDGLGFEFKFYLTDNTKPFCFGITNTEINLFDRCLVGLILNPDNGTLYVNNWDENFSDPTQYNKENMDFDVFYEKWYHDPWGQGRLTVGFTELWKPLMTPSNDTWYHVAIYFGNLEHITSIHSPYAEWDAWEIFVEITEEGGTTNSYGPFFFPEYATPTSSWARAFGFYTQTTKTYGGGIGLKDWRDNTFYLDDVACWWDPGYEPRESLIPPATSGVWTGNPIEFDELMIVRDILVSVDDDGGTILGEYRIKIEEDDWGDWFEFGTTQKDDLFIYCTAIQVRLTLSGSIDPVIKPEVDDLVVRYLPAESILTYRDGLVGKMRDSLGWGNKGQGDMKRWTANEMCTKEELRRTFQDLLWQRFLNGGTIFNFDGKAHSSGLSMYGKDLHLIRGDKEDTEFRTEVLGAMVFKSGTPESFLNWIKEMAGIEKGNGYNWKYGGQQEVWGSYWCPVQSEVDGKMTFIEWWKSGWILGGLFKNYLTENPEEGGLILGDTGLDIYEYIVKLRGYEGYPIYPTLKDYGTATSRGGYIKAGSPYLTCLYVYVHVAGNSTNEVEVDVWYDNFPVYKPKFSVLEGSEVKNFGDTLASDYLPLRYSAIMYYDGAIWTPLVETFGASPTQGEFKIDYGTRAITLATPVVTAGHNWQVGDQLDLVYTAYGVKETGWIGIPIEKAIPVGTTIHISADSNDDGARPGGIAFSVSGTGYLSIWHEELMATRDQIMDVIDKYRTVCTLPSLRYGGLNT